MLRNILKFIKRNTDGGDIIGKKVPQQVSQAKASLTLNGVTYIGDNIVVREDGSVMVDGVLYDERINFGYQDNSSSPIMIKISGDLYSLETTDSLTYEGGTIHGNVTVGNDVHGSISAGGNVSCGEVSGSVSANGSVDCEYVGGDVSAGGNVNCGDVSASNISAGGNVTCEDATGATITAGGVVRT